MSYDRQKDKHSTFQLSTISCLCELTITTERSSPPPNPTHYICQNTPSQLPLRRAAATCTEFRIPAAWCPLSWAHSNCLAKPRPVCEPSPVTFWYRSHERTYGGFDDGSWSYVQLICCDVKYCTGNRAITSIPQLSNYKNWNFLFDSWSELRLKLQFCFSLKSRIGPKEIKGWSYPFLVQNCIKNQFESET